MMIPDKVKEILKHEGVVAIATRGADGPHLVNTWHSYVRTTDNGSLLIPVGGMKKTEANLLKDNRVSLTLGSREAAGLRGPGAGFLLRGTARMFAAGDHYDLIKKNFSWARTVLEIVITSAEQTI